MLILAIGTVSVYAVHRITKTIKSNNPLDHFCHIQNKNEFKVEKCAIK